MSSLLSLMHQFNTYRLNPPYAGSIPAEIRGISLPEDYRAFLQTHNGGSFTHHAHQSSTPVELFSLEDIQTGARYWQNGYLLGSEHNLIRDHQDFYMMTVTDEAGLPIGDGEALYQAFYDSHLVIGIRGDPSSRESDYVDLLAIDRFGRYVFLCDGDAEELGRHEFGTIIRETAHPYTCYSTCLYESPDGLIEVTDGKGKYRIVSPDRLEILRKQYDCYRTTGMIHPAQWEYDWVGDSLTNLFVYILSGELD